MIECDPQPPFGSGHMSKASSATRRRVTGLVGREGADLLTADPHSVVREASAIAKLSWAAAIERVRARRRFGKR
ncbi:hypothetical protein ACQPXH_13240 [Nocardia sp. CA-135953]|uniref:hypothetical protein n=1 Tax=Nocardia sp. CA-135953 TaxID=3239978 RepID=UPI003D9A0226